MRSKSVLVVGSVLTLFGVFFLVARFNLFAVDKIWPLILLILGIGFLMAFRIDTRNYGFLMPAAILIVSSLPLFYCAFTSWEKMIGLWPLFLVAPAIGFFLMFAYKPEEQNLLLPAWVLLSVGLLFLLLINFLAQYWPLVLLVLGLLLIFANLLLHRKSVFRQHPDESTSDSPRKQDDATSQ